MALDKNSSTAMALRGILEPLIESKRRTLERPSHDWDKTQLLRGELIGLRRIYAEVDLTPTEEPEEDE